MSESFEKAVEAGLLAFLTAENMNLIPGVDRQWAESAARQEMETRGLERMRDTLRAALRAALPHLTAQDVPHLIRQAKAEAWGEGWSRATDAHPSWWSDSKYSRNPYAEEADHEHRA